MMMPNVGWNNNNNFNNMAAYNYGNQNFNNNGKRKRRDFTSLIIARLAQEHASQ
jgi:hypothetical protein